MNKEPRMPGLLEGTLGDVFFESLPDEELDLWNCREEYPKVVESFMALMSPLSPSEENESIYSDKELDKLDTWNSVPPKTSTTLTMKAQYKGRKKPMEYVLEDENE